jgi:hypothetical protein
MKNYETIKGHVWRLVFDIETKGFCWQRVGALMDHELIGVAVKTHAEKDRPAGKSVFRKADRVLPTPANQQSGKRHRTNVLEDVS